MKEDLGKTSVLQGKKSPIRKEKLAWEGEEKEIHVEDDDDKRKIET